MIKSQNDLPVILFHLGNGWAPSIPLLKNIDPSKSNIKDLLVRAKAGMQVGDVQKEAHLTFYLGMVHESKKEFKLVSIKE